MPIRNKASLILLTAALATPSSWGWGQIYKVIGDDGNVVFTDSPPGVGSSSQQSVEKVELQELNTTAPVEARTPATTYTTPVPEAETEEDGGGTVAITSPTDESTIAMGPGNFAVSASAKPALSGDERLLLLIDGQAYGTAQASSSWFVEGMNRGPHDLVVQRTTTDGESVATSEPVRVYVLRPSRIGR
jgi:hypothetical protein